MELLLARNHSALTHLPIASAILLAVSAAIAIFTARKEIAFAWASLSIIAFITALPTATTGVMAARGRFNTDGKPYLESGLLVSGNPANERVRRHEMLGVTGLPVSFTLAILGARKLKGRSPNRYLVLFLAVALAVLWGLGGHLGGMEMWGPDTFPAFK